MGTVDLGGALTATFVIVEPQGGGTALMRVAAVATAQCCWVDLRWGDSRSNPWVIGWLPEAVTADVVVVRTRIGLDTLLLGTNVLTLSTLTGEVVQVADSTVAIVHPPAVDVPEDEDAFSAPDLTEWEAGRVLAFQFITGTFVDDGPEEVSQYAVNDLTWSFLARNWWEWLD